MWDISTSSSTVVLYVLRQVFGLFIIDTDVLLFDKRVKEPRLQLLKRLEVSLISEDDVME